MKSVVLAMGGNAIVPAGGSGTIDEQFRVVEQVMRPVAEFLGTGVKVLLTHGNGPIVGNIMIRNEAAKDQVPPMPLYICGADSQGGIGFMLQQTLANELVRLGSPRPVATVVTQVLVDAADPAFANPTKPIGPFYAEADATRLAGERSWVVREDSRRGYRRLVASPRPLEIVEADIVERLLDDDVVVIAVGGGGVPVVRDADGLLRGVDAVVDKDRAASVIASRLGFEALVFITATDHAYVNFGQPDQTPLKQVTLSELKHFHDQGHFPPGSMGPKIDAAIAFLEAGGRGAVIASPGNLVEAMAGRSGTHVIPDGG